MTCQHVTGPTQDQPHVIQRSVEEGGLAAMIVWENEKVSRALIA